MMNWIISSSLLILVVIALRFCLKGKISLRLQYGLWALVLVRLLVPVSIGETAMSIGNWLDAAGDTEEVQQVVEYVQTPILNTHQDNVEPENNAKPGNNTGVTLPEHSSGLVEYEASDINNTGYTLEEIAQMIWLAGMLLVGMWFIFTNARFSRKLEENRVLLGKVRDLIGGTHALSVYRTNDVETPCLHGFASPAIYVTDEAMEKKDGLRHVLEHEMTHYLHRDYIWSILRVACLILHWYNPLVWCAAFLSRRDAELACDEATIQRLGETARAAYGRTLIDLTCEKRPAVLLTATTMTGSKKSIKERIVLIAKKPEMAIFTLVFVLLILVIAVLWTFTGAKSQKDSAVSENETETEMIDTENIESNKQEQKERLEQLICKTTADLNHDGIEDSVNLMTQAYADRAWLDLDNNGGYFKVFLGIGNDEYETEPVYTSNLVAHAHAANGTYVLTEKDGKDYLLYSTFWEGQGLAGYHYSVMYIKEGEMVEVETAAVEFVADPFHTLWLTLPSRADVIPDFKAKMNPWIENGTIIISYDVSTPAFIIGKYTDPIPASSYYDIVWARDDEEQIAEFEAVAGTEKWQQALYYEEGNDGKIRAWIENEVKSSYSKWYTEYDGSKLQRVDNCTYGANVVGCSVPASCDVIYYRADAGEDEQDAIKKMIERMVQARMVASDHRPYVITDYSIPEQNLYPISEDMWLIPFLNGYYAYEGTDLGTMQEIIASGTPVTEDGLIPFNAQGSTDNFFHILIEKDGVYRLQRLGDMMN